MQTSPRWHNASRQSSCDACPESPNSVGIVLEKRKLLAQEEERSVHISVLRVFASKRSGPAGRRSLYPRWSYAVRPAPLIRSGRGTPSQAQPPSGKHNVWWDRCPANPGAFSVLLTVRRRGPNATFCVVAARAHIHSATGNPLDNSDAEPRTIVYGHQLRPIPSGEFSISWSNTQWELSAT